ncbi:MAG TPA: glycosyl hydrolase 115 family protein [Chitinophagaceae bacterium]|nr:glycosyl hydrolase 115 family protein [Chitinophagaceae bacterium]
MKHQLLSAIAVLLCLACTAQSVTFKKQPGAFELVSSGGAAMVYADVKDVMLVRKAAALFCQDVQSVTGKDPFLTGTLPTTQKNIVIIGTIDHSPAIRQLIEQKKLSVDSIRNKWEAFQVSVVDQPFEGIGRALVIAGSDRRGTAFGVFELSRQMGVSPWYWWADVPVKKNRQVYIDASVFRDAPLVKYRGIFINDEAPALSGWTKEKFGGFNHVFYEKVFELMLRLKSNYLWPAMWGNAFYDDDPLNMKTADDYGIVIGTSHHEPLMRAHDEWRRYGKGKWNYDSNEVRLREFWREGLKRTGNTEKIVSIGMRGDGDEPMTQGTAIALLERITRDQRTIIEEVTGKPASETPQLWALYKEVQDYYDKGMRVPDDVTLLLCDDNWGNIRRLPKLNETSKGGYGIYYHFDYVGGPRNYKWVNTNQVERVWEQMHLAWEYGVKNIWIVNVGDIKPMEFPISFFLDYAWNPQRIRANDIQKYYEQWASQQFGEKHAKDIASIIHAYTKFNARRKPELLSAETYSLYHYNEAERVVKEYKDLEARAQKINKALPSKYRDAYYQLVLHPVEACANLHEMYLAAAQGNAEKTKQLFIKDSLISLYYNKTLAGGKWSHMMDQTHIGYTYWQQPPYNVMPVAKKIPPPNIPERTGSVVSFEAEQYTKPVNANGITWQVIPGLGRTLSGITPFPVTAPRQAPGTNTPRLEYAFTIPDTGKITVHAYFSPTLDYHNIGGMQYGIAIDDEPVQLITVNRDAGDRTWGQWVANNIIIKTSAHTLNKPGGHVLKFYMVDAGLVLQKIVIDAGGLKPSYLGPPPTGGRQ